MSTIIKKLKKSLNNPYYKLSRPNLSLFTGISALGAFIISAPAINPLALTGTLVGVTLSSFSTSTFNQIIEKKYDKLMPRTASRPLPLDNISHLNAILYGTGAGVSGLALLAGCCNVTSAMLSFGTMVLYLGVYTPLKRRSELNIYIGSVVGAIPPLIGCAAATGTIFSPEALFSFTFLFLWQLQHFFCISWAFSKQYEKAGFHMPNNVGKGFISSILLTLCCLSGCIVKSCIFGIILSTYSYFLTRNYKRFYINPSSITGRTVLSTGYIFMCFFVLCALVDRLEISKKIKNFLSDDNLETLENLKKRLFEDKMNILQKIIKSLSDETDEEK